MPASYLVIVIVIVHILAAFVWLGGMLFLGDVGAPVLRRIEPAALRQRLFREIGLRFRGAARLARANAVLAVIVIALAARLARGG